MKDMEFLGTAKIDDPMIQMLTDNDLKPAKVYHAGDYEREHVVIEVFHDCDLSDYALVQIERNEEDLPNYGKCHFLTFDDIELFEGDTVKVMTCRGKDHEVKDGQGHTIHVLYWNLPFPVWNEGENEVMIMERGNSVTSYLKNPATKEN